MNLVASGGTMVSAKLGAGGGRSPGTSTRMTPGKARAAAVDAGFADARPLSHNAYKITIARNATLRAIELAARIA